MSFSIGLSGLRATNQDLGTISQNIANVSTAGFKAGRSEFAAIYSGGQPGGVEVAKVSLNFDKDGDQVYTGRALDLAIAGGGFFVTNVNGQTAYTRAGTFNKDLDNYIVATNGGRLQGYPVNATGQLLTGVVQDLRISTASMPAKASTKLEVVGNLKSDASVIDVTAPGYTFDPLNASSYNYSQSGKVYDSLGTEHVLTQYFIKTGANTWQVNYTVDGADQGSATLSFDAAGRLLGGDGTVSGGAEFSHTVAFTPAGANPLSIDVNYGATVPTDPVAAAKFVSPMSQYAGSFAFTRNQSDGYASGDLAGVRVEENGNLYAVFSNGQDQLQGQVVMANFANPDGLRQGNSTSWYQSFASGQPVVGVPGSGTLGKLTAGAYEGSNVELSDELVNLMTAQRNYQANSKSIAAADKMTQVLFNAV